MLSGRAVKALWDKSKEVSAVRSAIVEGNDVSLFWWSYTRKMLAQIRVNCSKLTSRVFKDPKREISCCISTISLFHNLRTSRSCASYHAGLLPLPLRRGTSEGSDGGKTGSFGTAFRGSGVIPR